jgi:hypothetical protein
LLRAELEVPRRQRARSLSSAREGEEKAVYCEPVTVAALPQGSPQTGVNRNSDQLFGFAFRQIPP